MINRIDQFQKAKRSCWRFFVSTEVLALIGFAIWAAILPYAKPQNFYSTVLVKQVSYLYGTETGNEADFTEVEPGFCSQFHYVIPPNMVGKIYAKFNWDAANQSLCAQSMVPLGFGFYYDANKQLQRQMKMSSVNSFINLGEVHAEGFIPLRGPTNLDFFDGKFFQLSLNPKAKPFNLQHHAAQIRRAIYKEIWAQEIPWFKRCGATIIFLAFIAFAWITRIYWVFRRFNKYRQQCSMFTFMFSSDIEKLLMSLPRKQFGTGVPRRRQHKTTAVVARGESSQPSQQQPIESRIELLERRYAQACQVAANRGYCDPALNEQGLQLMLQARQLNHGGHQEFRQVRSLMILAINKQKAANRVERPKPQEVSAAAVTAS